MQQNPHKQQATFAVDYTHRVHFTRDALDPANDLLARMLTVGGNTPARCIAFVDTHLANAHRDLPQRLRAYAAAHAGAMTLVDRVNAVPGGELCKNDRDAMYRILERIQAAKLDRQSFVLAIGGGAVLDVVGFAAAIAHRGVRLIRLPTTTLAQADSGVGVKNGINGFGQKNYLGTFAVPWAVINDERFLHTLPDRQWRDGFVEAVKVALIKDRALFERIERDAAAIVQRDMSKAMPVIEQSAMLHLCHITEGGDPFETQSARPLDFGHWAAHQLETMSDFALSHGKAVAIGIAIDVAYAARIGMLDQADATRIHRLLQTLGFSLTHPAMQQAQTLLQGIESFREHLGGELTITMLRNIGSGVDVHEIDHDIMTTVINDLAACGLAKSNEVPTYSK